MTGFLFSVSCFRFSILFPKHRGLIEKILGHLRLPVDPPDPGSARAADWLPGFEASADWLPA
jgi:hypothetical protein